MTTKSKRLEWLKVELTDMQASAARAERKVVRAEDELEEIEGVLDEIIDEIDELHVELGIVTDSTDKTQLGLLS